MQIHALESFVRSDSMVCAVATLAVFPAIRE